MNFSNSLVAEMLRQVAAALTIKKGNLFQVRAYDNAADSIEHSTSEIQDLWEEDKLGDIPGIGKGLQEHLEELFKTGKVKHWDELRSGIPAVVFDLLNIKGVGPQTALKISKSGVKTLKDLKHALKSGTLVKKGFSSKIAANIEAGLNEASAKTGRMLLPYAFAQAEKILEYLKKSKDIEQVNNLGSLRRRVATIGDLDFSLSAKNPEKAIDYLAKMPGITRVINQGETKITLALNSGLQLDFLVVHPDSYGALLQHFTGSKNHNIHLRTLAERKGLSLSENGIKNIKTGKVVETKTEEDFYKLLGMQTPPPEIREDGGEIEAAIAHKLPKLVELAEIKGDLHLHSSYNVEPSHDLGADSMEEMAKIGKELGYDYVGISDHSPSQMGHTKDQMIKIIEDRRRHIEHINSSSKYIRVLNLLEVDILPNGEISIPDEALKLLDFAIAGVHSSHGQTKELMTKRILRALENPYVKVLSHPTGRLLNERDGYDADWEEIFKFAAKHGKAMEINAFYNRLDLPDMLARRAKEIGVKFLIGSDAHKKESMENMKFGIFVAKRAWLEKSDVLNTLNLRDLFKWFRIEE